MGICVENVAYSPDSVADYTLMLMLMILRNTKMTISRVQAYDYRLIDVPGRELGDLTIGVVGTGRIGTAVISRLQGFGARVYWPLTAVPVVLPRTLASTRCYGRAML